MSDMKNENIFLKFKKHSLSIELMHSSFKKQRQSTCFCWWWNWRWPIVAFNDSTVTPMSTCIQQKLKSKIVILKWCCFTKLCMIICIANAICIANTLQAFMSLKKTLVNIIAFENYPYKSISIKVNMALQLTPLHLLFYITLLPIAMWNIFSVRISGRRLHRISGSFSS